jgi:hypothetical protein
MGDSSFNGGWIFAFLIIAVIFGWGNGGFGGNNAAMAGLATTAEVQNSINAAMASQNAQNILLSSANNNYETARLIDNQSMMMTNQNNTNLLTAINGYNSVAQSLAAGFNSVNQNIADLGFKMENCCCSIKTMMLENRLADTQQALADARNVAVNQAQSEFLLNTMGKWVANAPAAAAAYTAAK